MQFASVPALAYSPHMCSRVILWPLAGFLVFSACQTAPDPQGPPPETVIAEAFADSDPYRAESMLSELLDRTDLTVGQRAEALYHRANFRRIGADDRYGALADYSRMLEISPEHELAEKAKVELELVEDDIAVVQERLGFMLTLPVWFDLTWSLGQHEIAAQRYQRSSLSPSIEQVTKLRARGFICNETGLGEPVHQLGDEREDLVGMNWCIALEAPLSEPELQIADEEAEPENSGS